jgi:hypothetical protein
MTTKSYTAKEMSKAKSLTNWDKVLNMKNKDIDTSDPDAPNAIELIEKGLAQWTESPFTIGADGELTIRKRKKAS